MCAHGKIIVSNHCLNHGLKFFIVKSLQLNALQLLNPSLPLQVDVVIGADGANSRVAKEIDAGEYDYAIAFQERIRIPDDKMDYYKDLAEMYVGDDVSPDFYGWVFPKYDHVAVGTGTVVNKTAIKQYQQATRDRSKVGLLCPAALAWCAIDNTKKLGLMCLSYCLGSCCNVIFNMIPCQMPPSLCERITSAY